MRTKEEWLSIFGMYDEGNSPKTIHKLFKIDEHEIVIMYNRYKLYGDAAFVKRPIREYSAKEKIEIVRSFREDHLTLDEVAVKYNVNRDRVVEWNKIVREKGYSALHDSGAAKLKRKIEAMGRPRKKQLSEMTEIERLRYENERLRAENALLKKVRALVEERDARLREIGRKPSKN